jgi:hypothetical protein
LRWADAGLLELHRDRPLPQDWHGTPEQWRERRSPNWFPVLERTVARELLATPARWVGDSDDALTMLCPTDRGVAAPGSEWIAAGGP